MTFTVTMLTRDGRYFTGTVTADSFTAALDSTCPLPGDIVTATRTNS
jgi:hypothetical protein